MSSKLDYLKKYVSKGEILQRETGDKSKKKKKRKKVKLASGNGGGNFAIVDDDVDWRSLVPQNNPAGSDDEDDPEDKPIVAEVRDETVVKWQPFGNSSSPQKEDRSPNLSPSRPSSTDISPPRHDLPDISPPRRKRHDSPDISPPRRKRHDSPDISPPRRKRHDSPDISPPRKRRLDSNKAPSNDDLSPPRKESKSLKKKKSSDVKGREHDSLSSPRRSKLDVSPPRKVRHGSPDISPPRRKRRDSPDISPPRRKRRDSPDISPPRRKRLDSLDTKRINKAPSNDDLSPPRKESKSLKNKKSADVKGHEHDSLSSPRQSKLDVSPPRKVRHDSTDISPPRRKRHESPDISPPRRKRHESPDISLPRRKRHNSSNISKPQPQISRKKSDRDLSSPQRKPSTSKHSPPPRAKSSPQPTSRPPRMSSGKKAGLQDAEVLRQENAAAREREAEMFHRMDPSESGLGAETVYRDKEGKRINLKLERLKKMQEENKKMEEEEKFMEWGKGVATIKMAEEKIKDELYEMSKPLARYADDEDLERMLKARERDGDPMLKFLKKKPQLTPTGKPKKERPTYKGFFPPSRFGIRPGFRWDGVDRTNGFEKAWFARESNRKATADDAYKWSVENM